MANYYVCPVCGFGMEDPPEDWNICPCCGVEFGYHDAGRCYSDLRKQWVDGGMRWWSECRFPPEGWNPANQLSIFSSRERFGFMCKVDFDYELGEALGGNKIHPSIEDLKKCQPCVDKCGIVEVEVRLKRVVQDGQF